MMNRTTMLAFLVAAVAVPGLRAQETAYGALRTLTGRHGEGVLRSVIEVSGRQGTPQPLVWRVVVADAGARGGVREFEISGGRILSERTPVARTAGSASASVVPLGSLRLDSDGAFQVVNSQAWQARVGFDSVTYALRREEGIGPVWLVEIFDAAGRGVGRFRISGTDGRVLSAAGLGERPPGPTTWPRTEVAPENGDGGFWTRTGRTLDKAGRSVGAGMTRAAGTVEYWFTGRQTVGAPPSVEPQPSDRD